MATVEEVLAKAAEWEAAGQPDKAAKLRAYAETLKPKHDAASVEAKAAEWEKAGQPEKAAKLRTYAATLAPAADVLASAPAPMDGPVAPPAAPSEAEARQALIDDFTLFEMANPVLRGRYAPEAMPRPGDVVMGQGGGGKSGGARYTVQPWKNVKPDTFGDTAAAMTEGPIAAAQAFAGGLTGGPSPSRDFLANDPLTGNLPGPVLTGLGAVGDVAGAGLSALGAGISGAIGLGAELVPGQGPTAERKLAEDLTGMSMFAVPELAGASSVPARMAATAPRAAEAVAAPVAAPTVKAAAPVAEAMAPEAVAKLANKAASGGMGATKAQEALAAEARINPEAKAAADRLCIDLPSDVFSDNETVKSLAGLTRSEVGKEAEALWRSAVKGARDKADEIMAAMDGSPDIASVSDAVKSSLQSAQAGLKSAAKKLYEQVDAAVPKASEAQVSNVVKALNEVIQEIGGIEGMSAAEKALFKMVTNPDQIVTYGRLMREKNLIGKAIARGESPYSSLDDRTLSRLYGALAEDQLATVAALGDEGTRAALREANQLTAKQKGLEKRIVNSFGSDLDGSIGAKLKSAVKTAAAGDIAGLQRILKVIPEDLRKQSVATALTAATRSARATEPGFGLAEFGKLFTGIKDNKPVYNLIGKTLGADAMAVLNDLHTTVKRISGADANVLRTGKANQAIVNAATMEGLVGRVLHSTAGQRIAQGAAIGTASAATGPLGGMIAGPLTAALLQATPDALGKLAKLFASDEFQALLLNPKPEAINSVARSKAFTDWAKAARVKDPDAVLKAIEGAGVPASQAASEAANANQRPDYEALWQRYGK